MNRAHQGGDGRDDRRTARRPGAARRRTAVDDLAVMLREALGISALFAAPIRARRRRRHRVEPVLLADLPRGRGCVLREP
jgi:hypothetical protein